MLAIRAVATDGKSLKPDCCSFDNYFASRHSKNRLKINFSNSLAMRGRTDIVLWLKMSSLAPLLTMGAIGALF